MIPDSRSADIIRDYLTHLRLSSRSPRTIEARADILSRADRELPYGLDQACKEEIAEWALRDGWKPQTKATYLGALRSFYQFCNGRWLDHDPTVELPRPHIAPGVPRPVRDDQLQRILTDADQPYRLWSLIAAYQGARCIEIARLHRDDMTEDTTYLHGKGDKPRAVPTHPDVWAAVQHIQGRVSAGRSERYISIRSAVYFRRDLDLPGVSMHKLRAWYLTRIVEQTGDPRLAQVLAGHASLNTTMIYLQVSGGRQRAAVDGLPRLSPTAAGEAADPSDGPVVRRSPLPT